MAESKPTSVKSDMKNRRVFDTPEDAAAYLNECAKIDDFESTPFAGAGLDEDGNFDPKVYTDSTRVMVNVLKSGGDVKAIVVSPVPTLDELLKDDTGADWVMKILDKELAHVSVRPLRDADDVSTMVSEMPLTRADYITSGRGQTSGIMEAFNVLYKDINTLIASKVPAWAKARLNKAELRKCFESAGYAKEYYFHLEDRGEGNDSLFKVALTMGINASKRKGLDPTIFERWLTVRDNATFTPETEDFDDDSLDLASLTDEMLSDDEDEAEAESNQDADTEAAE